ncbi:sugar phosphate isomerase/epimerase family protein [Paenibacillus allorhizosphaerae]|uniref:Xylose isomerase-like TIM barrel domain-containing protein n=1 Tax=Paenibacillus allorhizosphaerae TaxID=2849866 RepID=A0ABN7TPA0_9BACL|nr:TIM barrel protein [Paenibacillus allorhizosphaerae]CAG7644528.1 hypothetical protein PAECIP111802_03297 [Paenibacillus allorhizosphaerae]
MKEITYSLFPKFFQSCSADQLAEIALDCGFDAVDLVVRDGYWVTPERMAEEAAAFVKTMQRHKLNVTFATTGYSPEMLSEDDTPLRVMAENGIASFRMSYFSYQADEDLFAQMEKARIQMQRMAELCEKFRVKAVYQVHHGDRMLIQHTYEALALIKDLPSEYIGIMPDPGNQFHEGSDNWNKAIAGLGSYAAAVGVKDGTFRFRPEDAALPNKGWSKVWTPCQEGVTNWHVIAKALRKAGFQGVFNFQPFYHSGSLDLLIPALKEEVRYITKVLEQTEVADEAV